MRGHIIYHGGITVSGVNHVETLCIELRDRISALTLHLCSGGGDTMAGVGLFNFLTMMPFQIDTHCFGACNSIAVNVFLAGKQRTFVRGSQFSLHAASYADGDKKGQIHGSATKLLKGTFEDGLGWGKETIARFFASTDEKFLSGAEATELKIATGPAHFEFSGEKLLFRVDPEGKTPIDLAFVRAAAASARTSGQS